MNPRRQGLVQFAFEFASFAFCLLNTDLHSEELYTHLAFWGKNYRSYSFLTTEWLYSHFSIKLLWGPCLHLYLHAANWWVFQWVIFCFRTRKHAEAVLEIFFFPCSSMVGVICSCHRCTRTWMSRCWKQDTCRKKHTWSKKLSQLYSHIRPWSHFL